MGYDKYGFPTDDDRDLREAPTSSGELQFDKYGFPIGEVPAAPPKPVRQPYIPPTIGATELNTPTIMNALNPPSASPQLPASVPPDPALPSPEADVSSLPVDQPALPDIYTRTPAGASVLEDVLYTHSPRMQDITSVFNPPQRGGWSEQQLEENRVARILDQFGPTVEKANVNLNPSVSQISGVQGNYVTETPMGPLPISDEDAIAQIAKGNLFEAPNFALSRGMGRLMSVGNVLGYQLGLKDTGQFIDRMQELDRVFPDAPLEVQNALQEITSAKGAYNVAMAMARNHGAVLSVVGESLPLSIPGLAAGALTVNPYVAAGVVGASSGAAEYATVLDEEIKASGVDINDDAAMTELMADPEFWAKAKDRAMTRSLPIAVFDALSMGIAGKIVGRAVGLGRGKARVGGALGGELLMQSVLGGAGETAAQKAEQMRGFRDDFNLGEIGLETAGEIVPGFGETVIGYKPAVTAAQNKALGDALEAAEKIASEQNATQAAIELLNPNSAFYQPNVEQQIRDLAARWEAIDKPELAQIYLDKITKTGAGGLEDLSQDPTKLKFLRELVEREEAKFRGTAAIKPRTEDTLGSFFMDSEKDKVKYEQALNDPRTGPVIKEMREKIQMVTDRMHELGYHWHEVSSGSKAPQEIKNARDFIAYAGAVSRLVNQLNANLKGYKGRLEVSDERLNETISKLQAVLAAPENIPLLENAAPNPETSGAAPAQPSQPDPSDVDKPVATSGLDVPPQSETPALNSQPTAGEQPTNLPTGELPDPEVQTETQALTDEEQQFIEAHEKFPMPDNQARYDELIQKRDAQSALPQPQQQGQQPTTLPTDELPDTEAQTETQALTDEEQQFIDAHEKFPLPDNQARYDQLIAKRNAQSALPQPQQKDQPPSALPTDELPDTEAQTAGPEQPAPPKVKVEIVRNERVFDKAASETFNPYGKKGVDSEEAKMLIASDPVAYSAGRILLEMRKGYIGFTAKKLQQSVPAPSMKDDQIFADAISYLESRGFVKNIGTAKNPKYGLIDDLLSTPPASPQKPAPAEKGKAPTVTTQPPDQVVQNPKTRAELQGNLDENTRQQFDGMVSEAVYEGEFTGSTSEEAIEDFVVEQEAVFDRQDAASVARQTEILQKIDETIAEFKDGFSKEAAVALGAYKRILQNRMDQGGVGTVKTAPEMPNPQEAEPIGTELPNKPVVSVQTPDGQANFNVQGKVVELADLKQASGDLQPRDRSRKESEVLARERAGSMFNPERLLDDPTSGSGAPIIARDGTIISGNGRALTMQEVYANQPESLAKYNASLKAAGIDTTGFSQPIYVRQLSDDMSIDDLKKFADLSNTDAQAQMSVTERAQRDAQRLTDSNIIELYQGGEVSSLDNQKFASEFAAKILSPTEQGTFTKDGKPTREGIARMQNAILASAFSDADAIGIMLEDADPNIKAIANAFTSTAPKFSKLKAQIRNNQTPEGFDITPQLTEFAKLISQLRRDGVKLKDYYSQDNMFEQPDPEVAAIAKAFFNDELTRANSQKKMEMFLNAYADEALLKEAGGLIPDETTAQDVVEAATRKVKDEIDGTDQRQGGLFEAGNDVQSDVSGGKQVQRRKRAGSGKRLAEVSADQKGQVNDQPDTGQSESVSEVSELSEKIAFSFDDVKTSRVPPGTIFEREADSGGQSLYNQAFTDAGLNPDKARNLSPQEQFDILSKLVKDKFGFTYVEKSDDNPYMAVQALLNAYRNLQWMTHTIGLPNKSLGLDDTLGLGLPSRQWGGYLAAYFPKNVSGMPVKTQSTLKPLVAPLIVMPKNSNSFAHEWAHALDFHIVDQLGYDWHKGGITGRTRANLKGEAIFADGAPLSLKEAMGDLMNAMFFDQADLAAQIMSKEQEIAKTEAYELKTRKTTKKLPELRKQLERLKTGATRSKKVGPSGYKEGAERFGEISQGIRADYWTEPTEMFARAFEAYVAHRTAQAAEQLGEQATSEFVSKSNEAYQMTAAEVQGADIRLAETYPNQPDRDIIYLAFDRLFEAINNDFLQGNPAETPGDYDMIDARGELINAIDPDNQQADIGVMEAQRRAYQIARNQTKKQQARPSGHFDTGSKVRNLKVRAEDSFLNPFIYTKKGSLFTLAKRYADNPKAKAIIENIISRVATDPGSLDNRVTVKGGTFEEAVQRNGARFSNILAKIFKDHNLQEMSAYQLQDLRLILTGNKAAMSRAPEGLLKAAGEIRTKILNPMYDYMQRNNYDVDYLENAAYFPRLMDTAIALQDKRVFKYGKDDNGTRGAKHLFANVIYENEVGPADRMEAEDIENLLAIARNKDVENRLNENAADLLQRFKAAQRNVKNIESQMENDPDNAVDLEGQLMEAVEEMGTIYGELHEALRDPYAEAASDNWFDRLGKQLGVDPDRHSIQGTFAKKRKLPAEADSYMIDFYLDPVESLLQYIPAVVRKTEYHARFGDHLVPKGKKQRTRGTIRPGKTPERVSYLDYLTDELSEAGVMPADRNHIRDLVDTITGMGRDYSDHRLTSTLNTIHTFGMMSLLPRAMLSSIAEPLATGIQAGSTVKGFASLLNTMDQAFTSIRGRSAKERKLLYEQMANIFGVVDTPDVGEMVANRMGGTTAENPKLSAMMSRFFARTLLLPLTNAQRRGSMKVGLRYLAELASQYQRAVTPNSKEQAREILRDLGINDSDIDGWTNWMSQFSTGKELPNNKKIATESIERGGELSEYGEILSVAVNRFTNQSIQNPSISDRPKYAETPVGRLVYAIQSFQAAFTRNVIIHMTKKVQREYRERGIVSASFVGAVQVLMPVASLYMGQTIISAMREALTNPDKWEEEGKKGFGSLAKHILFTGFSRSGLAGRFDPLWNALRSVRYEADLTNILVGPNLSYYFKAIQRMAGLFARPNSPNTVAAEYQATRGAYDLLLPTIASMLVASPYLGPALGTAFGVGTAIASSSGFKHFVLREIIEGLTGERYYVGGSGRKSSSGGNAFNKSLF